MQGGGKDLFASVGTFPISLGLFPFLKKYFKKNGKLCLLNPI